MVTMNEIKPNDRVRITQTIRTREGAWQTQVEGTVQAVRDKPTGSWFAHGRNDKLWLHRILLKRDDGELTELVVDDETQVTKL